MKYKCNQCNTNFSAIACTNSGDKWQFESRWIKCPLCNSYQTDLLDICEERTVEGGVFKISCDGCGFFDNCWNQLPIPPDLEVKEIEVKNPTKVVEGKDYLLDLLYLTNNKVCVWTIAKTNKIYIRIANAFWDLSKEDLISIISEKWETPMAYGCSLQLKKIKVKPEKVVTVLLYEIDKYKISL